jgi:predicted ATPase
MEGVPTGRLSSNILRPLDSFIGRAEELHAVKMLLATHRLVTLTGAAGIGKTRLALRIGEQLAASYPDGVYFVGLVELTDPALVLQAVAAALGSREEPDRPLLQTIIDVLASRSLLLVWDNCDYLVEGCRALAQTLLAECPGVQILTTSRRSLHVHGEILSTVPPFRLPEAGLAAPRESAVAEAVMGTGALQLFRQRAREKLSECEITAENAAAVAHICRQLDGIPLAVELAAGRIRELSAQQIADRLDERFQLLTGGASSITHQQTLWTAIDWSNELLSEPERTLLARLSVFAGGWDLGAAERVCSGGIVAERSVLDLLTGLIDKSWIVGETWQGARRYRLLETMRDYSQERLKASGEAAELRACHGELFLKLAEEAEAELSGSVRAVWLDRLETEYENLRAALAWCLAQENGAELGVRLAGALVQFWEVRGYLSEGRSYLAEALGREGASSPTRTQGAERSGCAGLDAG